MKTFISGYKINFVDDNNVFVGFDNEASCCETFGHTLTWKTPVGFCKNENPPIDSEGFNFDTTFFKTLESSPYYEGGEVLFRLTKEDQEIFLTLYNIHNGYYAHGFQMNVGGTVIHQGSI